MNAVVSRLGKCEPISDSLEPAGIYQGRKWTGQFGAEFFAGFGHGQAVLGEDFYAPTGAEEQFAAGLDLDAGGLAKEPRFASSRNWAALQVMACSPPTGG